MPVSETSALRLHGRKVWIRVFIMGGEDVLLLGTNSQVCKRATEELPHLLNPYLTSPLSSCCLPQVAANFMDGQGRRQKFYGIVEFVGGETNKQFRCGEPTCAT